MNDIGAISEGTFAKVLLSPRRLKVDFSVRKVVLWFTAKATWLK